jgi:hypothetical protein
MLERVPKVPSVGQGFAAAVVGVPEELVVVVVYVQGTPAACPGSQITSVFDDGPTTVAVMVVDWPKMRAVPVFADAVTVTEVTLGPVLLPPPHPEKNRQGATRTSVKQIESLPNFISFASPN